MRDPRQYERPLCAEVGTDMFYTEDIDGEGKNTISRQARDICKRCQHITECAEWGIHNERYGIWGGLTPLQRDEIRYIQGIRVRTWDIA